MAMLDVFDAWQITDAAGSKHTGGSRGSPLELEVGGQIEHKTVSLAALGTLTVWDSSEALKNFDWFWLKADTALRIEITCDRGGENGTVQFAFVWPADMPFRLFGDDAVANYAGTITGGTADLIDKVRIYNPSTTTAANVEFAVVT